MQATRQPPISPTVAQRWLARGAFVAWIWLAGGLGGVQLVGAGVVLAAIVLAQTAR